MLPKLSDFEFVNRKFNPGDRILAKVTCKLTKDQYQKIERAIIKAMGEHVRVLIVNVSDMKLVRTKGEWAESLTGITVEHKTIKKGIVGLDCTAVEFNPGDTLVVLVPEVLDDLQKKVLVEWLQRWTGQDVEIRIVKGTFCHQPKLDMKTSSRMMIR